MEKKQAAALSIISNSTLILFKLIAGIFMGSISVISEAIHSSIDLIASLIAFFSIRKASQAEDYDHPFGHGKYENVSGFVEAILILIAALLIIYEAAKKLINGVSVQNETLGILVMFFASAVNFTISRILYRISKKTHSIALEADAAHLLTDVYTSLGVFAGLILLKITGIKIIDPITALLVSLLIIKTSVQLIRKSMVDLVDSKLPDEDIKKITSILDSYPNIMGYHKLRTRKSGETREIDLHLLMHSSTSIGDAHLICDKIENKISQTLPNSNVTVHVEPSETNSDENK